MVMRTGRVRIANPLGKSQCLVQGKPAVKPWDTFQAGKAQGHGNKRKNAKGAKKKLRSSITVASTSSSLASHIPVGKTIPALIWRVGVVAVKDRGLSC